MLEWQIRDDMDISLSFGLLSMECLDNILVQHSCHIPFHSDYICPNPFSLIHTPQPLLVWITYLYSTLDILAGPLLTPWTSIS